MNSPVCCCAVQRHISDEDVANYILTVGEHSLLDLKKLVPAGETDITMIRFAFQASNVPFRVKDCGQHLTTCCGVCTRSCSTRCVQDILHRAYMYTAHLDKAKYDEWPALLKSLYAGLHPKQGLPNYKQIVRAVLSIVSRQYNKELEKSLTERGYIARAAKYENHPHRFVYSPRLSPERNPETGLRDVLEWPQSGLCPFCVPRQFPGKIRRKKPGQVKFTGDLY